MTINENGNELNHYKRESADALMERLIQFTREQVDGYGADPAAVAAALEHLTLRLTAEALAKTNVAAGEFIEDQDWIDAAEQVIKGTLEHLSIWVGSMNEKYRERYVSKLLDKVIM